MINGQIVTKDKILHNHVLIFDKKIKFIMRNVDFNDVNEYEIIDLQGKYVSPGLIDMHIHGVFGCDTMDATKSSIQSISNKVIENGVTAILPTTMTFDKESIHCALENIRGFINKKTEGAHILGANMEGPFISPSYKGAQSEKFIRKPDFQFIKDYLDVIKMVVFAPEIEGAEAFLNQMKDYEIGFSIGHSGATYKDSVNAYKKGMHHITHCFNAMSPLHHREPGVVGAALTYPFTCELICDNIHVAPEFYEGFINIKGTDKVVLISDSMRAACMEDGEYELGGQKVYVKNGSARLEDDTLAGSILKLNIAVKNILDHTGLEMNEAIHMASLNPARVIGVDNKKGSIEVGKDADLFVHDEALKIYQTIIDGKVQYKAGEVK